MYLLKGVNLIIIISDGFCNKLMLPIKSRWMAKPIKTDAGSQRIKNRFIKNTKYINDLLHELAAAAAAEKMKIFPFRINCTCN